MTAVETVVVEPLNGNHLEQSLSLTFNTVSGFNTRNLTEVLLKFSILAVLIVEIMEGLWKKESTENGACYIDLLIFSEIQISPMVFQSIQPIFRQSTIEAHKNDAFSMDLRDRGNQQFRKKQWREAMELYNRSLRYAADGSDNISLAYGNRSACFFYLQMYSRCLIDIQLAKAANYPQHLMRKLDDRKAASLTQMQKSAQKETVPLSMSYAADETYACLANVLELRTNDEFGKHFVAKSDLKVGEIVMLEEMFAFGARSIDRTFCSTCLKVMSNFIPCHHCTSAFCDAHCLESNELHKIDCGASYHYMPRADDITIVKSILIAVNAFATVDDLMAFVESALAARDVELLNGLSNSQVKYGRFLKLLLVPKVLNSELIAQYWFAYRNLLEIREIQQRFNTKQKSRFLMHLIWHHILIVKSNTYTVRLPTNGFVNTAGKFTALLNHSCTPNVFITFSGNQQMAITIHPVKKGDQLFTEYKNVDKSNFTFVCKCTKCVPCYKEEDCLQMQLEPTFGFIRHSDPTYSSDDTKLSALKSKCQEFLTKYGHLPWTPEIQFVSETFENCLDFIYMKL